MKVEQDIKGENVALSVFYETMYFKNLFDTIIGAFKKNTFICKLGSAVIKLLTSLLCDIHVRLVSTPTVCFHGQEIQ